MITVTEWKSTQITLTRQDGRITNVAMIRDMVKVTIKELKLNKVEPTSDVDWKIVDKYLLERCK